MCSLQGHRQRSICPGISGLWRRKLAQRAGHLLRPHGPEGFQSNLSSITLPLFRMLASLYINLYPQTTLHPLILVPLVGSPGITAIVTAHQHHGDLSGCAAVAPPVSLQPPLFISIANKRPPVSKKPDETNNITWPELRHFTRKEWNTAVSIDQRFGNMFYGFHCAPFELLATNETKCKIPIIASLLPKFYIFLWFPPNCNTFIIHLKIWYRFKYCQITSGFSVNLLNFCITGSWLAHFMY